MKQEIPINEKYSLTINEAANYFSIGVKNLRRLTEKHIGVQSKFHFKRWSLD